MTAEGFRAFGRTFSDRVADWRADLRDLEAEGVTYEQWILEEEDGGPGLYRVRFSPAETYQYVRAAVGWDEYLQGGFENVSDRALAREAMASAKQRSMYDPAPNGVCPADFLGDEVEALVCGWRLERAERLRPEGSSRDPLVLLHDIASGFPIAARGLTERAGTGFSIKSERDLQDALFMVLRSVFHDARREEWTPSAAGSAKRIDIAVPSSGLVIETKFVRNRRHGPRVADELRVDIESYHSHPACQSFFALVWDPESHIRDPHQLERDLTGSRTKGAKSFSVSVRVI